MLPVHRRHPTRRTREEPCRDRAGDRRDAGAFLNARAFDDDAFTAELDRIAAHVRASMATAA
jgi:hypothetical protein